jgi:hypothetical protein
MTVDTVPYTFDLGEARVTIEGFTNETSKPPSVTFSSLGLVKFLPRDQYTPADLDILQYLLEVSVTGRLPATWASSRAYAESWMRDVRAFQEGMQELINAEGAIAQIRCNEASFELAVEKHGENHLVTGSIPNLAPDETVRLLIGKGQTPVSYSQFAFLASPAAIAQASEQLAGVLRSCSEIQHEE